MITSPKLRREAATVLKLVNCRKHTKFLLYEQMSDISVQRLDPHPSTLFGSWSQADGMLNVNNYQRRSDLGSKYPTFWVWITLTLLGVNEPFLYLPGPMHISLRMHIWLYGSLESHLLVAVVPTNKQWITLWTSVFYNFFPVDCWA
jgi:hypothetical protein